MNNFFCLFIEFEVEVSVLPSFINLFYILRGLSINFKDWKSALSRETFLVIAIYHSRIELQMYMVWMFTAAFFQVKSLFLFYMFQSFKTKSPISSKTFPGFFYFSDGAWCKGVIEKYIDWYLYLYWKWIST